MRVDRVRLNDFIDEITSVLYRLNADNRLEEFLEQHNFELDTEDILFDRLRAKILIIGQLAIDKSNFQKLLKENKIDIDRVEIVGEYYDTVSYPWDRLRYNDKYSDVILGPMPHSGIGKGDYASVISRVQNEEGFPNVILASADATGGPKLTKSSLKAALEQTMFKKYCCKTKE